MRKQRKRRSRNNQYKKTVTLYKQKNDKPNWIRRIFASLFSWIFGVMIRELTKQALLTLLSTIEYLIEKGIEFCRNL